MSVDGVHVGLKLIPELTTVDELRAVWRVAEDAGFDHCWTYDHLLPALGAMEGPVFDGWTLLGALAEATTRVRIGVLVTGNTYRNPGLLAKIATTVDHLSGGRLDLGIGAGWAEREHQMFDLPFGTVGQRIDRLAETCGILKLLWTEERCSFDGRYYHIVDAISNPRPIQTPHPPIWIGGRGERKTLRVVARFGDVWNVSARDADNDVRLSRVLDGYCEELGREPASLRRSVQIEYTGDVERTLREAEPYVVAGFREVIITLGGAVAGRDPVPDAHSAAEQLLPRLRLLPAG